MACDRHTNRQNDRKKARAKLGASHMRTTKRQLSQTDKSHARTCDKKSKKFDFLSHVRMRQNDKHVLGGRNPFVCLHFLPRFLARFGFFFDYHFIIEFIYQQNIVSTCFLLLYKRIAHQGDGQISCALWYARWCVQEVLVKNVNVVNLTTTSKPKFGMWSPNW